MRYEGSLDYKCDKVEHANQPQGWDKKYLYWKFGFVALNVEDEGWDEWGGFEGAEEGVDGDGKVGGWVL